MYDTINIGILIKCPHCGNMINFDLQTKDGPRCLNHYNIGDKFPIADKSYLNNRTYKGIYPISVYGICPRCKIFINGLGRVDIKTLKLKEVELYNYTMNIKPEIIIKETKKKKNGN